jgi:hypothetical protein
LKTCIEDFNIGLRILQILVADLPNSPLGTQVFKFIDNFYFISLVLIIQLFSSEKCIPLE